MNSTNVAEKIMVDDLKELIPWIRSNRDNAVRLWCAFANVQWIKEVDEVNSLVCALSFRSAGALVGQLYMKPALYRRDPMNYLEFYCSGPYATICKTVSEHLRARGWVPYGYDSNYGGNDEEITEVVEDIDLTPHRT